MKVKEIKSKLETEEFNVYLDDDYCLYVQVEWGNDDDDIRYYFKRILDGIDDEETLVKRLDRMMDENDWIYIYVLFDISNGNVISQKEHHLELNSDPNEWWNLF